MVRDSDEGQRWGGAAMRDSDGEGQRWTSMVKHSDGEGQRWRGTAGYIGPFHRMCGWLCA